MHEEFFRIAETEEILNGQSKKTTSQKVKKRARQSRATNDYLLDSFPFDSTAPNPFRPRFTPSSSYRWGPMPANSISGHWDPFALVDPIEMDARLNASWVSGSNQIPPNPLQSRPPIPEKQSTNEAAGNDIAESIVDKTPKQNTKEDKSVQFAQESNSVNATNSEKKSPLLDRKKKTPKMPIAFQAKWDEEKIIYNKLHEILKETVELVALRSTDKRSLSVKENESSISTDHQPCVYPTSDVAPVSDHSILSPKPLAATTSFKNLEYQNVSPSSSNSGLVQGQDTSILPPNSSQTVELLPMEHTSNGAVVTATAEDIEKAKKLPECMATILEDHINATILEEQIKKSFDAAKKTIATWNVKMDEIDREMRNELRASSPSDEHSYSKVLEPSTTYEVLENQQVEQHDQCIAANNIEAETNEISVNNPEPLLLDVCQLLTKVADGKLNQDGGDQMSSIVIPTISQAETVENDDSFSVCSSEYDFALESEDSSDVSWEETWVKQYLLNKLGGKGNNYP